MSPLLFLTFPNIKGCSGVCFSKGGTAFGGCGEVVDWGVTDL